MSSKKKSDKGKGSGKGKPTSRSKKGSKKGNETSEADAEILQMNTQTQTGSSVDGGSSTEGIEGYLQENKAYKKDVSKFIDLHLKSGDKTAMTYTEEQIGLISRILDKVKEVFRKQPTLLKVVPPITVVGDIHGQFFDLKRIFRALGKIPTTHYLFLGDYVDRGEHSLECIMLLLAYKSIFPNTVVLLRGNHECENVNRAYGFFDEMHRRGMGHLYKEINAVFNWMPLCALIKNKILCMHGGISQHITSIDSINEQKRPLTMMPPKTNIPPMAMDLLWADPDKKKNGYNPSKRGVGGSFGNDVLDAFCKLLQIDFVCRGHQVVERGFERVAVGGKTRLVTIFSAPNYCGEMDNCAAAMIVDDTLKVKFSILEPSDDKRYTEQRKKVRQSVPATDCYPDQEAQTNGSFLDMFKSLAK